MSGPERQGAFLDLELWRQVQAQCKDVPGPQGIALRREQYAPFFQRLGRDVVIDENCWFDAPWRIVLDDGARINRDAIFEGSSAIHVGRNARIGHRFFAHSANHDISVGPTAFFERGYHYKPVVIGDNVLISACVSVMPGACIGAGSFVAANTLVPGKDFPADSDLRGVPATARPRASAGAQAAFAPAPELVLLGTRGKPTLVEGARLLATVLGCPQIAVLHADEPLPESVRVAVLLDPAVDENRLQGVSVWRLVDGNAGPEASAALRRSAGLPDEIVHEVVANGFGAEPTLLNIARSSFFYCLNSYRKAPGVKRAAALPEWLVCRVMALSSDPADARWRHLFGVLARDLGVRLEDVEVSLLEALAPLLSNTKGFAEVRRALHAMPHLLPLWAYVNRFDPQTVIKMIRALAPAMNTSERKAALACACRLVGDDQAARAIREEITSETWRLPNSATIRTLPQRTSPGVAPVLLAFLVYELVRAGSGPDLVLEPLRRPLHWHLFDAAPTGELAELLYRASDRVISLSLFDNWLALQELPEVYDGGHFYLGDACYRSCCAELEDVWRKLVRCALGQVGRPTIELKPWPAGYRFALAVRYDVDRDVAASKVRSTVEIQKRRCGGACGSWYFFAEAPFNERIQNILRGWNQEHAIHACRAAESAVLGRGVTAHSGANSEYWRGRRTIEQLRDRGADYAEAMVTSFAWPRPGWLGDRRTGLWLTPLHFPLEGSTADQDTGFFDQRLEPFRCQRDREGLVIVGTHPDCNESILDQVLGREDIDGAWPTTVGKAVERVRSVLDCGAIVLGACAEAPTKPCLLSRETLADVCIRIYSPGQADHREVVLQLVAGVPRAIDDIMPFAKLLRTNRRRFGGMRWLRKTR